MEQPNIVSFGEQISNLEKKFTSGHSCSFFTTPCNMCKKMVCIVHSIESKKDPQYKLWFCNEECENNFFGLKTHTQCNKTCQNIDDAARRKCLNCVKLYSEKCVPDDINKALKSSSGNGCLDIVKFLVWKCNADVNYNYNEYTPLALAAGSGHYEVVKFLIYNKADINTRISDNDTALIFSCYGEGDAENKQSDFFECQKILLANGADPNLQNDWGNTALHYILGCYLDKKHNGECSKLLLKYDADPNIKNNKGQTPAEYALKPY